MEVKMLRSKLLFALALTHFLAIGTLGFAQPAPPQWWLGISTHPTNWGYHVDHVYRDSPAWEAGLYERDYIEAVDGRRVGNFRDGSFYSIARALNQSRTGEVELRVSYRDRFGRFRTAYLYPRLDDRSSSSNRAYRTVPDNFEGRPGDDMPPLEDPSDGTRPDDRPPRESRGEQPRSDREGRPSEERQSESPSRDGRTERPSRDDRGR